jgi:hypothetical protein
MRFLFEILIIGALIYFGWETPFRDRIPGKLALTPKQTATPAVTGEPIATPYPQLRPIVRSTPSHSGAWMWDPSHRSPLDPPKGTPTPRP